jgi:hypothetical protein
MSAPITRTGNNTKTPADFPSAPPGTLPRAELYGYAGQTRVVVLNGSRVHMRHDGRQWWNVKVEPAE